jgi:hypothetical protein
MFLRRAVVRPGSIDPIDAGGSECCPAPCCRGRQCRCADAQCRCDLQASARQLHLWDSSALFLAGRYLAIAAQAQNEPGPWRSDVVWGYMA